MLIFSTSKQFSQHPSTSKLILLNFSRERNREKGNIRTGAMATTGGSQPPAAANAPGRRTCYHCHWIGAGHHRLPPDPPPHEQLLPGRRHTVSPLNSRLLDEVQANPMRTALLQWTFLYSNMKIVKIAWELQHSIVQIEKRLKKIHHASFKIYIWKVNPLVNLTEEANKSIYQITQSRA